MKNLNWFKKKFEKEPFNELHKYDGDIWKANTEDFVKENYNTTSTISTDLNTINMNYDDNDSEDNEHTIEI